MGALTTSSGRDPASAAVFMSPALQSLLGRVVALPECPARVAEGIRSFREGDRSPRLFERLRPELHPTATAPQAAIWWALFAISHVAIPDADGEAEAIRQAEDALLMARSGPPTVRHPRLPPRPDAANHWGRGRASDAPGGAGWYYAVARRYDDHREQLGETQAAFISTRPSGWYFAGPRRFESAVLAEDGLVNDLLRAGAPLNARPFIRGPFATEDAAVAAREGERPTDPCPAPAGALEGGA